jgi:hypothetical protein
VNSLNDTTGKYRDNWFNRIWRMDHSRFPRHMLSYKPTGKRSLGRPRKRWISQIWGAATGKSPMHEEVVEEEEYKFKGLSSAPSRGNSVQCLATDCTTGRSSFDPRQRQEDFSSNLCVQTGSGTHPASCTMGTGDPFPGGNADHSPHLVQRWKMSRSYTSPPPAPP